MQKVLNLEHTDESTLKWRFGVSLVFLLLSHLHRLETQKTVASVIVSPTQKVDRIYYLLSTTQAGHSELRESLLKLLLPLPSRARDSELLWSAIASYHTYWSETQNVGDLLLAGQTLRTKSVCWKGTFIPFRWEGDCNLMLLHFSAVIGCFYQSRGNMVWPTLISFCGTYLHIPNRRFEKCHSRTTLHWIWMTCGLSAKWGITTSWDSGWLDFPQIFFLLSKSFLYWADISAAWSKTFFIPDLYSTHKKVCKFEL